MLVVVVLGIPETAPRVLIRRDGVPQPTRSEAALV
jgi:hypothetical protein